MTKKILIDEITDFIKDEGYEVVKALVTDYGKTVKLVVKKDETESLLPLLECFYDTDSEGNLTKFHGMIDIRESKWYRKRKYG